MDRKVKVIRGRDDQLWMRICFDDGYEISLRFAVPEMLDTSYVEMHWNNDVHAKCEAEEVTVHELVNELSSMLADDLSDEALLGKCKKHDIPLTNSTWGPICTKCREENARKTND